MTGQNLLFITGMARSGTTLLEKLICNHTSVSMLSQPCPFLFIELKKQFLRTLGQEEYYVLNDSLRDSKYTQKEFIDFAENYVFLKESIESIFQRMKGFSGQKTKTSPHYSKIVSMSGNLVSVYCNLVKLLRHKDNPLLFGSKEIFCEEFIPLFIKNGIKTIIIVRDPRDVLASANYPRHKKYLGEKKPALFILRTWRKSIEYIEYLRDKNGFYSIMYEDLTENTFKELDKVTEFLGVDKFGRNTFKNGIKDQQDNLWKSNSSHESSRIISRNSIGSYKSVLSKEEIQYTECICGREMDYIGYLRDYNGINKDEVIRNFRDYDVNSYPGISANYSSRKENIEYEINRGIK